MSIDENSNSTGQQVKILLLGATFSAILFSASLAIPFIGFAAGFMAASPIAFVRLNVGLKAALFSIVLAAIIIGIPFKPPSALWYLVQCALTGIIIPQLLLKGRSTASILLWGTAIATTASAITALAFSTMAGQGLHTLASKEITAGVDQAIALYEQQKALSSHDLELIRSTMKQVGSVMIRIYPALATLNILILNVITLFAVRRMASRLSVIEIVPYRFKDFKSPEILIWFVIISGFTLLMPTPILTTPAMNILTLLLPLYFLQGLAVVLTFADRSQFSGLLKVLTAVLLITQPYLIVIITITGLFDLWGDFRSSMKTQE